VYHNKNVDGHGVSFHIKKKKNSTLELNPHDYYSRDNFFLNGKCGIKCFSLKTQELSKKNRGLTSCRSNQYNPQQPQDKYFILKHCFVWLACIAARKVIAGQGGSD